MKFIGMGKKVFIKKNGYVGLGTQFSDQNSSIETLFFLVELYN